jgi:hypothetical protein
MSRPTQVHNSQALLRTELHLDGDKKWAKTYHVAPPIPSQRPCSGDGGGAFPGAYAGELELSNSQRPGVRSLHDMTAAAAFSHHRSRAVSFILRLMNAIFSGLH